MPDASHRMDDLRHRFHQLLTAQRTGALGTTSDQGWPYVSMAPYGIDPAHECLVIHVSELGAHTRYLLKRPQASFMICSSETPGEPVHALPRITFQVEARPLERGSETWQSARAAYLERFPDAGFMIEFKDFHLFHLYIVRVRQVSGFGAAKTLHVADARRWLGEPPLS